VNVGQLTNTQRIEANTNAIRKLESYVAALDARAEKVHGELASLAGELEREIRPAIRELELAAATIKARMDHGRETALQTDARLEAVASSQAEVRTQVSLLEQRVADLHQARQTRERYLWMLAGVIVGAVVAANLNFIGNVLIELLRQNP
jgi:DNA repair exonuclease SbcCD ATPase subunit